MNKEKKKQGCPDFSGQPKPSEELVDFGAKTWVI